jgi:hypothetical protein
MEFLFFVVFLALAVIVTVFGFSRSNLVFMAVGGLMWLFLGIQLFYPVSTQTVTNGFGVVNGSVISPQITTVTVSPEPPFPQFFGSLFLVTGLYSILSVVDSFRTRDED